MSDANKRPAGRPAPARRTAAPAKKAAAPRRGGWLYVPDLRYALMKWALLAGLLVYAILVIRANSARNVDFSLISGRMTAAPGLEALHPIDGNGFQDRFGIAPEGLEGWLLYGADEIMNVSELMIARSSDAAALDRLEDAVRARLDSQLDVFRNYGVEQAGLLDGAALWRRGDYLFYGVGEDTGAWEDAFLSCVR